MKQLASAPRNTDPAATHHRVVGIASTFNLQEDNMKVLLAGASGALGVPTARHLTQHGHEVLGLARDPAGGNRLLELGVTPVIADALDRNALLRALEGQSADAVIHELTALRKASPRHSGMALTNRLRTEGTTNLLAAARQLLGAPRFLTQSIILGYGYRDHGKQVLTEEAPFGVPQATRATRTWRRCARPSSRRSPRR
jgi:nucleoside-diphosphate-sugar epimerase